ncbi:DUF4440 domain-containing protein [Aquimarina sp. MMG016]|uniref:nuclear transport factor 2 family protein n=1 Tax=Aquimarina sp. MMG016 TaxID=2822690 RepID=UPI001B3A1450|nr:DUF4440 domain-containing protein [Aquimarina sp. MMG016]MBQ4822420.1 DUF4440 domain-containing protein [Aquimarina sp. MMG016]
MRIQTILSKAIICTFILMFSSGTLLNAQSNTPNLEETILNLDKQFWKAYNTCNAESFKNFLTEDLEFYHDKGGLTEGLDHLLKTVRNSLCAPQNPRLRREVVAGTLEVHPLNNYGAILSGEHVFYITEKGKEEKLIEKAKFTHVWQHKDNTWKMSRVLSYDHQPTSENAAKKEIKLSDDILATFVGQYKAPKTGLVNISVKGKNLQMNAGKMQLKMHPQSETLFFAKEMPLTFEFIQNQKGKVLKFIVRENGKIVEEAKRM